MAIAHAQDFSRVRAASAAALPLLADGRFPSGGHAHSGGLEAAVALEHVDDLPALESFLRGRLHTAGVVAASFAAAACAVCSNPHGLERGTMLEFEAELDARMPSPALRSASRKLGRQLLRAGRTVWPHPHLDELSRVARQGVHHPIALGAVAAAAGLSARDAALVTVHESCASAATAAVRLLGLDPFGAYALLARLSPELNAVATEAAKHAESPPEDLPAWSAPLLDVLAEQHARWEVRLFAS